LCLFNQAISYAIQLAMSKVVDDPYLIWPYTALAVACFITAFVFPTYFRHLDAPMRNFADPDRQFGREQPNYKADSDSIEAEAADSKIKK
jgi:POT family proton-dependent oligopeptide transporter